MIYVLSFRLVDYTSNHLSDVLFKKKSITIPRRTIAVFSHILDSILSSLLDNLQRERKLASKLLNCNFLHSVFIEETFLKEKKNLHGNGKSKWL